VAATNQRRQKNQLQLVATKGQESTGKDDENGNSNQW